MGHTSRWRAPPSEFRFVRTPTGVKHLTAAEFYRSLIMRRRKKKNGATLCFFERRLADTCVLSIEEGKENYFWMSCLGFERPN